MCRVGRSQLVAAVERAREGGWPGVGRSWRSRMLGASLCLPAGNRLSGSPKAYRCPAGRWLRAGERLGDTELRMGPAVPRQGGKARLLPLPKPPLPPSCGESTEGAAGPDRAPARVRAQQDGDSAGSPQPEPWWPQKGPCLVPSPPAAPSPPNIEIYIFCFVYTACTEYTASDNYFPVDWKCLPR